MHHQTTLTFASASALGVIALSGLHLRAPRGVSKGCVVFGSFRPLSLIPQSLVALFFIVIALFTHFLFTLLGLSWQSGWRTKGGQPNFFVKFLLHAHRSSSLSKRPTSDRAALRRGHRPRGLAPAACAPSGRLQRGFARRNGLRHKNRCGRTRGFRCCLRA